MLKEVKNSNRLVKLNKMMKMIDIVNNMVFVDRNGPSANGNELREYSFYTIQLNQSLMNVCLRELKAFRDFPFLAAMSRKQSLRLPLSL